MIWLLLGGGVYFCILLRVPQVRYFGQMFRTILTSRQTENGGVSSFQALCMSLAARVGTGNLAGVATALYAGGPGALFWMWVTAVLGMATSFAETILAQLYREKVADGLYRGGPAYYIEKGLGKRWMGIAFAVSLIFTMGLVFNAVQANSIVAGVRVVFDVSEVFIGLGLIVLAAFILFRGTRRIIRVSELIVPFMSLGYVGVAVYVLIVYRAKIPEALSMVFESAFNIKSVAGGGLGYGMAQAFRYGVARGLFSNEAGMGSTPNAAAAANVKHPVNQGLAQMLGVFIDTPIVCTSTAIIILLSGQLNSVGLTGVELTQVSMVYVLGDWGKYFISVAIFFFAFTTIIANYYYAETNLKFITKKKVYLLIYRLLLLCVIMLGALAEVPFIWQLADLSNCCMAAINLVAILLLSNQAAEVLKDYERKVKAGDKDPGFDWPTVE